MTSKMNRRKFMQLLAAGGASSTLGTVGQLALMNQAVAATPDFSDYKALVCVFMLGGNDGFNMLVPSDATHADYAAIRAALAVQKNDLGLSSISSAMHNGTMGGGSSNLYNVNLSQESAYTKGFYDLGAKGIPLGVNAVMPEFAQLVTDDKLSIIANSGNMVAPVTREQIQNKTANLPLFLFAHNHQQRALQTGQADNLDAIGWAGKIADSWAGVNNNSSLGLNISYSGNSRLLIGDTTSPLILNPGNPSSFNDMKLNAGSWSDERRDLFRELIAVGKNKDPFQKLSAGLLERSMNNFDLLTATWERKDITYSTKGPYGESLFDVPSTDDLGFQQGIDTGFIPRMENVAKMIDLGVNDDFNTGNYKRQIFFVGLGGYDTHARQADGHAKLLRELSLGLWKFQKAMEELGHADKVTTFSMSDFGRTLSINAGGGTDHAWGSHHFVMGGSGNPASGTLNGGTMIGTLPDLNPDGPDDYSDKGRIIPTTSQDQVNASICQWFGLEESLIPEIFPNVSNFASNPSDITSAYLNDLFIS
ncbi:DUF1501 domain-containing protein [Cocleimonas flava]|uniref:Secreted protein n=1 Tax=Cocleimonas flava TaxID=634765 RepID=A0A4R1EUW7_9GAMM|nr:DUF1501 domain-containing protein [Cocleimonas flava]TCJ84460.1 secreted protein [Cocleimonas flava]